MLTWLSWFMIFKGLTNISVVKLLKSEIFEVYGEWLVLLAMWGVFTLAIHITLVLVHQRGCQYLFPTTAVLGMICMAFAFGQNDLANAASPGLATLTLWRHGGGPDALADIATAVPIPTWALFGCGVLMASGMFTSYAQRVTRAEVNTGSQFDQVALYAPNWCKAVARFLLRSSHPQPVLAPQASLTEAGKKVHYDSLRASVITGISAGVIAFASGRGLPVSTTYVAFAAVLGTGFSDRVYSRGNADTKLGRAIWVISCWFLSPLVALVASGILALLIYHLAIGGIVLCFALTFATRTYFKRRADSHEQRYHAPTSQRAQQATETAAADADHL
jgi:hypothetical protein